MGPHGVEPQNEYQAAFLAKKRAETARRAVDRATQAAAAAESAAAFAKKKPPSEILANQPASFQLEALDAMHVAMATTFASRRNRFQELMMASPTVGTSYEDPIFLSNF